MTDEGPDDMPAHLRTALTGVQLSIPLTGGRLMLGTWQGVYLFEHRRAAPSARDRAAPDRRVSGGPSACDRAGADAAAPGSSTHPGWTMATASSPRASPSSTDR